MPCAWYRLSGCRAVSLEAIGKSLSESRKRLCGIAQLLAFFVSQSVTPLLAAQSSKFVSQGGNTLPF